MILKCIIVDDQPQAVQILKNYIKKIPFLELTGTYSDSQTALLSLKKNPADLVFLDIHRSLQNNPAAVSSFQLSAMVIFTSSNKKYAFEGFEYGVLDFLAKPILFERFYKAAERAYKSRFPRMHLKPSTESSPLKGGFIFIKEATRLIRVDLDDIYYVMGLKNYVSILTKSQRYVSLQTMKQMEELLPSQRFIRVHRSYFVALDKIISVEKQQIHVKDKMIPIGNIYLSLFMKKLTKLSNQ
jgi:DNA-binding LytR/AlgR family response regulator